MVARLGVGAVVLLPAGAAVVAEAGEVAAEVRAGFVAAHIACRLLQVWVYLDLYQIHTLRTVITTTTTVTTTTTTTLTATITMSTTTTNMNTTTTIATMTTTTTTTTTICTLRVFFSFFWLAGVRIAFLAETDFIMPHKKSVFKDIFGCFGFNDIFSINRLLCHNVY